jgi:hypothetical protein
MFLKKEREIKPYFDDQEESKTNQSPSRGTIYAFVIFLVIAVVVLIKEIGVATKWYNDDNFVKIKSEHQFEPQEAKSEASIEYVIIGTDTLAEDTSTVPETSEDSERIMKCEIEVLRHEIDVLNAKTLYYEKYSTAEVTEEEREEYARMAITLNTKRAEFAKATGSTETGTSVAKELKREDLDDIDLEFDILYAEQRLQIAKITLYEAMYPVMTDEENEIYEKMWDECHEKTGALLAYEEDYPEPMERIRAYENENKRYDAPIPPQPDPAAKP